MRCFLYIKGTYGTGNLKCMHSLVTSDVTVRDDLGNHYDITVNGGGGSSGPNGFDYKWEGIISPINGQSISASKNKLSLAGDFCAWESDALLISDFF